MSKSSYVKLPTYLIEHILSFVDFGTMIKNISVPVVYRYMLSLKRYVEQRDHNSNSVSNGILETLEPFYHLNRYKGLTVFDICRFLSGFRLDGTNISLNPERWILDSQYHRLYGPAKTYRSITGQVMKEVWYQHDTIHRYGGPAVTLYYDNGPEGQNLPHRDIYFRYDRPHSYNGGPTMIEYSDYGTVIRYWHNSKTGSLVRFN